MLLFDVGGGAARMARASLSSKFKIKSDPGFRFPISFFHKFHLFLRCLARSPTNLTTDFTDPIWIKERRPMPQIYPDPILSPSVVKNALVDPSLKLKPLNLNLSSAPSAPFVAALRLEARGERLEAE